LISVVGGGIKGFFLGVWVRVVVLDGMGFAWLGVYLGYVAAGMVDGWMNGFGFLSLLVEREAWSVVLSLGWVEGSPL
jgi:hypothetical protein